ncbi:MAG: hypothetical protein HQM12_22205, partial [SAR324 cluster bacterium]|nr:hypothetical protein [SAR324 cluster bacterium]
MLLEQLQNDGFILKNVSSVEYSGPCPFCGGTDRFRVKTDKERFFCRHCRERGGDIIDYLREFKGVGFQEAKALVQGTLSEAGAESFISARPSHKPETQIVNPDLWQAKTEALVEWAHQQLIESDESLEWLNQARGLTLGTIKQHKIGYIPRDIWRERKAWGLSEKINNRGQPVKMWIPAGILIPEGLAEKKLTGARVRRFAGDPRYVVLSG